ncbi:dipeptidase [Salisediminibacterium selenitireducens]|uniref:Membrane dipeptidase n=1 Tax=Bacillus selenitireducens (strain ATCC 700615 / DSM 15326 / MLS10) TaxID=439292 RepID=D6XUR9_BACIE|nr:dipeptidase [Salisediminibacterium selenitireducens]ADH99555.1 Membrane dipeptidase [[Bacillus] selenitireducens MLS10]
MNIYDLHCDALLKLYEDRTRSFKNSPDLEVNAERIREGQIKMQFFAIFIEPDTPSDIMFDAALQQIDLFHTEVLSQSDDIVKITSWHQLKDLKSHQTGAVLTLEGADAFGNDFSKWRILKELGVMSLGVTWNQANLCCDGIGESRGGGLTDFGKEIVAFNNRHGLLTDVSHISLAGFEDVLDLADFPIATHSNAYSLCSHRRNLRDEQLDRLIEKGALIGVVFNPPFIDEQDEATIPALIRHIDYICKRGGSKLISFGSDFDGIASYVKDLDHAGAYQNLITELLKSYSQDEVEGFAWKNAHRFLTSINH